VNAYEVKTLTWRKVGLVTAYRRDDKKSPSGWLTVHWDQLRAQRSVTSMREFFLTLWNVFAQTVDIWIFFPVLFWCFDVLCFILYVCIAMCSCLCGVINNNNNNNNAALPWEKFPAFQSLPYEHSSVVRCQLAYLFLTQSSQLMRIGRLSALSSAYVGSRDVFTMFFAPRPCSRSLCILILSAAEIFPILSTMSN